MVTEIKSESTTCKENGLPAIFIYLVLNLFKFSYGHGQQTQWCSSPGFVLRSYSYETQGIIKDAGD